MNEILKTYKTIFLIIILLLNFSCAKKEAANIELVNPEVQKINPDSINETNDKLKFNSGIRSILHDSKGNYWFGSHKEGVCLFDGKSFAYFTVQDGLSNNQVRRIQEDDNGNIWFGTGNGVSSYDGEKIINQTQGNSLFGLNMEKQNNWALTKNDLWFNAGNNSGVYRFDGKELAYLAFPIQGNNDPFNLFGVTSFSRGINNNIWIGTYAAAFGYDGKSFKIIDGKSLGYYVQTKTLHIRSILEDSKGRLWIGNNGIGVLLVDGDKTINFSEEHNLIHSNSSGGGTYSPPGTLEHVFAIGEDSHGNIWFGDRDTGAWKYDGKSMTNYIIDENNPVKHIWEIYEDKNGTLLFAMESGGVYQFNGKTFERKF